MDVTCIDQFLSTCVVWRCTDHPIDIDDNNRTTWLPVNDPRFIEVDGIRGDVSRLPSDVGFTIPGIRAQVHLQFSTLSHDDVIKWKHFPRNGPFVRGIHRSR